MFTGPKIVTDDLVFVLDVSNHKCASNPSSGISAGINSLVTPSLCEGASGNPGTGAHTPNTANMPAYSSDFGGVLDFSGGRGINVNEDLGSTTGALTYSMWVKWPLDYTSSQYFLDARNNGGVWYFPNYASFNVNWNSNLRYNFGGGSFDANKWAVDEWIHVIVSSDSSGSEVWINGSNRTADADASNSTNENLGVNFRIGTRYTTTNSFRGLMGPIHLYKNKFDDNEALTLFNSFRDRFKALSYENLALKAGW